MAKNITFSYKGKDYVLEFNRKTIERLERTGFNISEFDTKPMSVIPTLFAGAFLMHHQNVKREKIDEIFDHITNKSNLLERLVDMYTEPITSLTDEPEESEENVEWEQSW